MLDETQSLGRSEEITIMVLPHKAQKLRQRLLIIRAVSGVSLIFRLDQNGRPAEQ